MKLPPIRKRPASRSRLSWRLEKVTAERDQLRARLATRDRLLASLNHELRTPLTALQGYSEMLLQGPRDEATQRQFLEIIHRHALRIAAIVEGAERFFTERPPE